MRLRRPPRCFVVSSPVSCSRSCSQGRRRRSRLPTGPCRRRRSSSAAEVGATASAWASGAPTARRSAASTTTRSSRTTTREPCSGRRPRSRYACCSATERGRSRSRPRRRSASRTATARPTTSSLARTRSASRSRSPSIRNRRPQALPSPLTFRAGSAPLTLAGHPYRGALQVQRVGQRAQVVDVVSIDAYVRGVVNEEVPDDWPLEAIKAQAVAARSYALSTGRDRETLYADTRSQVYGGIDAETKSGDAAVAATKRQVLKYDGKIATTFFYSSSGGRTANVTDVFSTPDPIPYLVAVPDPDDKFSPYHRWGPVVLTATKVSRALGVPGTTDLRTVPASGRARTIVATGKKGETSVAAADVRAALGLRSTWITPGVLTLTRPAGSFAGGSPIELTGSAHRVKGPIALEQREPGDAWSAGARRRARCRRLVLRRGEPGRDNPLPADGGRRGRLHGAARADRAGPAGRRSSTSAPRAPTRVRAPPSCPTTRSRLSSGISTRFGRSTSGRTCPFSTR